MKFKENHHYWYTPNGMIQSWTIFVNNRFYEFFTKTEVESFKRGVGVNSC